MLLGDGECLEGSVWEAAQFASQQRLTNLIAIVDKNNQCVLDYIKDSQFADKWKAFGWHVIECNGNSIGALKHSLAKARRGNHKPSVIIAHTTKGKGVSFMERALKFHHTIPSDEEYKQAKGELNGH